MGCSATCSYIWAMGQAGQGVNQDKELKGGWADMLRPHIRGRGAERPGSGPG